MAKQVQIIMNNEDEKNFSKLLIEAYPKIVFLDHHLWPEGKPMFANSIDECTSSYCYIWNKEFGVNLYTSIRSNGWMYGAPEGVVIQFQRSNMREGNILLSGRIAVDDVDIIQRKYINNVFMLAKKVCETGIYLETEFGGFIDKSNYLSNYIVGYSAVSELKSGKISRMKSCNSKAYFCPKSLVEESDA